jgi:Zn finger protein HypA/HybF involved in hydrogenase expression
MAERWAFCDRCDRWFYAQSDMSDSYQLRCPVCDSSPSQVRDGQPDTTTLA